MESDLVPDVRSVVAAHLPGYSVDSVVRLGEGQENTAYEVNGELIVRFSKEPDPAGRAALVENEARLLAAVAGISPLPVPEPRFTVPQAGCLAYTKVPGLPLLDVPRPLRSAHATSIAAALGELLAALHAVPADRMAELVGTDDQPLPGWLSDAEEMYAAVDGGVPAVYRRRVEAFLDEPPPDGGYALVFTHNDLGIEHVLVDAAAERVTGVIDWGDAALADPAYDFGLLYRDLGPAALGAALDAYAARDGEVAALVERAVFYARCSVLEDLAYGLETGRVAYVDKSVASMEWLFPPGTP
jgi:aminoglycoside phosphotransferase (APT) family kinase protein